MFEPERFVVGPNPATLQKWDELLAKGQRVVGIGNADAHGSYFHFGPFSHRVFPYDYLFSCVNTHILTENPLTGNVELDRKIIYRALRLGHCYIGYEIPGSTRGFRFGAQAEDGTATMGDTLRIGSGVTMQIRTPDRAYIKLIHNGRVVREDNNTDALTYTAMERGAYRVEVWREYLGQPRCWILSNPIYLLR
jgi:hypothetical protein